MTASDGRGGVPVGWIRMVGTSTRGDGRRETCCDNGHHGQHWSDGSGDEVHSERTYVSKWDCLLIRRGRWR
jgi:hypothetical protein